VKKITLTLLLCIQIQWLSAQCSDGEIELWDNCYGIDITYELNLSGQGLSGVIPNTIAELSNLMFLDLSNNNLEGIIPQEIVSMETLLGFNLSNNSLSGGIPEELGSLTNLMSMDLSHNQLSGIVPNSIGNMTGLVEISLDHNQLSGELPFEIGHLMFLSEFHANDNQFTGIITDNICESGIAFNNPLNFNIDNNSFCPPYPDCLEAFIGNQEIAECQGVFELFDSLYYADDVLELDLSNSGISGNISQNIGNFTNLISLNLSQNDITGPIPSEIGNLAALEYLNLSQNDITGPIPSEIGNLVNLKELKLYVNSLNGALPGSIGNLINLEYFNVFNNQISGRIPSDIGNMEELKKFYIHQNLFYDTIPPELFELSGLIHLYLNDNDLTGEVPININNLQNLERLRLQNNNLFGYLPDEICNIELDWDDQLSFNISGNNLCSELPYCIDGNQGDQNTSNCENVSIEDKIFLGEYRINSAFPNPFNPTVTITYQLANKVLVEGAIYDIRGNRITTLFKENQSAGKKVVIWNGKNQDGLLVSAGVYYFRLSSGSNIESIKLSLVK